jgi:hypothetical protein
MASHIGQSRREPLSADEVQAFPNDAYGIVYIWAINATTLSAPRLTFQVSVYQLYQVVPV